MAGHSDVTGANLPRTIAVLGMFFTAEQMMRSLGHVVEGVLLGRLTSEHLSAATLSGIVLTLVFALPIELGTGLTTKVAQSIGARDERAAAHAIGQMILLCAALSLPFAIFGVLLAPPVLFALGAEPRVLDLGIPYLSIGFAAMFVLVLPFPLSSALRALGNAGAAAAAQLLQTAVGVIGLPILVLGLGPFPRLEAAGAMVALVIARAATLVYQLAVLRRRPADVRLRLESLRPDLPLMRSLLALSLAPAGQLCGRIGADLFVVRLVASHGTAAVAAYSILLRILDPLEAIAQGVGNAAFTVIGHNLGARRPDRARRGLLIAVTYATGASGCLVLIAATLAPQVVRFFNTHAGVLALATQAVRIVTVSFFANAVTLVLARAFHASNDTVSPFVADLVGLWLVQLPLAFVLAQGSAQDVKGIWIAIAVANFVRLLGLANYYRTRLRQRFALPLHTQ